MTARLPFEQLLENRHTTRMARDDRTVDRLERREREAEALIGELCKEGRQVFYINIKNGRGVNTGRIREGTRAELIAYLLRNGYV